MKKTPSLLVGLLLLVNIACTPPEVVRKQWDLWRERVYPTEMSKQSVFPRPFASLKPLDIRAPFITLEKITTQDQWGHRRLQIYIKAMSPNSQTRHIFAQILKENKAHYDVIWMYHFLEGSTPSILNGIDKSNWSHRAEWFAPWINSAHKKSGFHQDERFRGITIEYKS